MQRLTSYCPWLIEDSDLNPAGEPELVRHLIGQRQIGMRVWGSVHPQLEIGMVALRLERIKGEWVPLAVCIEGGPHVS